jgi:hypothetical protein
MGMTFEVYYAILVGGIVLVALGLWLLQKSITTIPVMMAGSMLAAGLGLIVFPTAQRLRAIVTETRSDVESMRFALAHLRHVYEMQADQFTRQLLTEPKYQDPRNLNRYEVKVYSQNGEDGMIGEIFRRISTTNKFFVEFGSSDGRENNTVFLLNDGWRGLWMDGDDEAVGRAKESFADYVKSATLEIQSTFVTAENIEALFKQANVPEEFDLLSIDIDRNDYYVWKSIRQYRPRVVVIEYNAIFPAGVQWVIPYDANAWWDGTSRHGASLTSLELLGREKGYELVGCTLSGVNALFVRKDLVSERFQGPYTAVAHYEPPRHFLAYRSLGHPRRP